MALNRNPLATFPHCYAADGINIVLSKSDFVKLRNGDLKGATSPPNNKCNVWKLQIGMPRLIIDMEEGQILKSSLHPKKVLVATAVLQFCCSRDDVLLSVFFRLKHPSKNMAHSAGILPLPTLKHVVTPWIFCSPLTSLEFTLGGKSDTQQQVDLFFQTLMKYRAFSLLICIADILP